MPEPSLTTTEPSRRRIAGLAAALVSAAVLGGVVGGLLVQRFDDDSPRRESACRAESVASTGLPSIVTVSATDGDEGGTGSGVVIRSDGYLLTNNHVISVAADRGTVSVRFSDGRQAGVTIVGRDPDTDLAVLRTEDDEPTQPILPGDSSAIRVGQPVVALGAPLGLSSTVTAGIVSALNRTLPIPGDDGANAFIVGAVQTDASINPGNSGGALVDCSSRLVGINTAIITAPNNAGETGGGSVGLGFAIPVDLAMRLGNEIIESGHVSHPTFGLEAQLAPLAGTTTSAVGLLVTEVAADGPAQRAGIRTGDVILRLDGQPVNSIDALVVASLTRRAGDEVELTVGRAGEPPRTVAVTLATPS